MVPIVVMARAQCSFKLVFLGDTAVGKSCLVGRFVRDEFLEYQESTIGAAFVTQTVTLSDVVVKFEIWDTAGQERYRSLAPMYYRGASAAIVVFDITKQESFDGPNGAKSWVKELQRRGEEDMVICLCGNKCDLAKDREVDKEEAIEYAKSARLLYVETSARTGKNVKEMFTSIADKLPKNVLGQNEEAVKLRRDAEPKKSDGCC